MDGAAIYEINESSLHFDFNLNIFFTLFHCHGFDWSYFMKQGVYRDNTLPQN